ncbi:MAG: twin transmembrane helix small protein [Pseudomonadota bacterium]
MGTALLYLGGAACIVTVVVLAMGIRGFGTGKMTPERQNRMMRYRIGAQFVAVILMVLAVWLIQGD